MNAVLYDDVATHAPAPVLRIVPDPVPVQASKATRSEAHSMGGDPLVAGAARLLCVQLRQIYAALWRAGVLEVSG